MSERDSKLYEMVREVLEIKDRRIEEVKQGMKEELLATHLQSNEISPSKYSRLISSDETVKELTRKIKYLEENRKRFWQSMYDIGFLVNDALC